MEFRRAKVLVVDDEQENLDAFSLNFDRKFTVITAKSGPEALKIALREPIAVSIADQRMPGMTGSEFLGKLREESPETVRIILTGYTDIDSIVTSINEGSIHSYIAKPWDAENIEMLIRSSVKLYYRAVDRLRRLKELSAYKQVLGMIAANAPLQGIVREILKLVTYEFGYDRVFLLLGDPSTSEFLRGQCVERKIGQKPRLSSIEVSLKDTGSLPVVVGGTSFEAFTLRATEAGKPRSYSCGPFYVNPLRVHNKTVGIFAAGYSADPNSGEVIRPQRDDARLIATLSGQIALAISGGIRHPGAKSSDSSLPQSSGKGNWRKPVVASPMNLKRYPVLIVDDEKENLEAFRLNFESTFTVHTATSAEEGLDIWREFPVAVIITDQRMPGMSGVELLAEARQKDPDCVRIILTGYTDIDDIIDAMNRGLIYRYLKKPWNPEDMGETVRSAISYYYELVEGRRLLREAEVFNRLIHLMLTTDDFDRLVDTVLRIAVDDLGHDRAYFFRYDDESGYLVDGRAYALSGALSPSLDRVKIPVIKGGGLFAQAALGDYPLTSRDLRTTQPLGVEFPLEKSGEMCVVPMVGRGELLGVLAAEHIKDNPQEISLEDERTLATIANQLGMAMQSFGSGPKVEELATASSKGVRHP